MKTRSMTALTLSILALGAIAYSSSAQGPMPIPPAVAPAQKIKTVEIDLDKCTPVPLPRPKFELKATVFHTPDGKDGWQIRLPEGRPIATPAYWDGMIFVGGGYGSHEFYAFDANSGALKWQYKTSDDGPTAAVVESGMCAFNTESCTVFVLDAKTGKLAWKEWLGDPLMSQPAIYKDRLYMAYPGGQGQNNNHSQNTQGANTKDFNDPSYTHRLLCADLKTGKHLWIQPITADAISAPVINDGKVLLTCQNGTSFCFDALSGKRIWKKDNAGTSAPLATKQGVIFTERELRGKDAFESVRVADARQGDSLSSFKYDATSAPYLANQSVIGLKGGMVAALDSSVGFSTAPQSAQLDKAQIPVGSVVGGWAYQGSRVAARGKNLYNVNSNRINSIGSKGENQWNAVTKGRGISENAQMFSPPALGKEQMYLASANGHILSVNQKDGKVAFNYSTDQPITFQPALADGNIYVGTSNGMVLCLKTGAKDADGWTAWGGNAQHNQE